MRSFAKWMVVPVVTLLFGLLSLADSRASQPPMSAHDLVQAVIANEINPQTDTDHWLYDAEIEKDGRKQTKEVAETPNGSVEHVLAVDGHPLSPEKQQEEMDKIKKLTGNTRGLQKWQEAQKKEAEETTAFMKMIPDAFVFRYAGSEAGLLKLTFTPNPNYQTPSREARVLHAMEGEILVEGNQKRLAGISGHLMEEVKFGGGWFGYLEKGGTFSVKRCEVRPKEWALAAMEINMKGKALFLKTISVQEKETRTDFRKLPDDLTLGGAAEIFLSHVVSAANHQP